jgi:hypothetical protein
VTFLCFNTIAEITTNVMVVPGAAQPSPFRVPVSRTAGEDTPPPPPRLADQILDELLSPELYAPTPSARGVATGTTPVGTPDIGTLAIGVSPEAPDDASSSAESDEDADAVPEDAAAVPEDADAVPDDASNDGSSGADTFVASDEDVAAAEDAAAPPPPPDMLAELKNESIFALSHPHLSCRDENCRDFKCLQSVQHAREFPTGAAAKLPGSGINMYAVYLYRHGYVRWGYDCGDPTCRGARAYISRHQGKTVVRCRKPCNRVRHRPFKDQNNPLFTGRNPERVIVYIACLVWGMPVPLCRATACHTHRRLSVDLNKVVCAVAAAFNARQVAVEQGTWATVQADEMAIGARKR